MPICPITVEQSEDPSHETTPVPDPRIHRHGHPRTTVRHDRGRYAIQAYVDLYELEPSANKLSEATETLRRMVASSKIGAFLLAGSELASLAR